MPRMIDLRIAIAACLLTFVAAISPAFAQRGHSPFQATPQSEATVWRVSGVVPLEIAGSPVALSPDGQWIAGLGPDRDFCVWAVADLAATCDNSIVEPLSVDSFAWAPDSSAVAFSIDAYRIFVDSDIYVFELADQQLHNVTDDGFADRLPLSPEPGDPRVPIDVMPAWTPDSSQIVFARTTLEDADSLPTEVVRIDRDGANPETLASHEDRPHSIFTPMHVLSDGSVIYALAFSDPADTENGVWRVSPDGTTTQLIPGNASGPFPMPIVTGVWEGIGELRIAGFSALLMGSADPTTPIAFSWSSATGEATTLEPVSGDPRVDRVYLASFAPDGQVLQVVQSPSPGPRLELAGSEALPIELPESDWDQMGQRPTYLAPDWSDTNVVLVQSSFAPVAYLVTMEPAS